jgi:hypothetical protein
MGSYPHVNPGDAFQPSVQEENDIRDLLNAVGRDGVRANRGGTNVENICINAYNPGSSVIEAGTVVIFADAPMIEGAVQVTAMAAGSDVTEWAIAQEEIPAHGFGSVLVMGVTIVPISGEETGNYVVPNGGGATFSRSSNGIAKILRLLGSTSALILVGSSSGGGGISYVAGDGIDGDLITGGTIAGNYIGGTNVNIVPVQGSTNGQMQIDFSGGGGVVEYDGPFTVTMTGTSVCKVWNPHVDLLAGKIRIGSRTFSVDPKTDISVSWNGHVYVTVTYNSSLQDKYAIDFTSTLPMNPDLQPQFWYRELAFVDGYGVAHQSYWGGNIEIEGRWCD